MQDYWLRQEKDKPLFADILWSRPESKQARGKLLIVGGNLHGFVDVGLCYMAVVKAGAGTVRVLLPDALLKTVGKSLENCIFAPSTPSGSFAQTALSELLISAAWADCVLLAGDFGRNSETAIMLESFVQKYTGLLVVTGDGIDYFYAHSALILDRPNTCIVATIPQLQKLAVNSHFTQAITTTLDLVRLVEILHEFQTRHSAHIITQQEGTTLVAAQNKISTTQADYNAATIAVFWLQTPQKPYESLTTSLLA